MDEIEYVKKSDFYFPFQKARKWKAAIDEGVASPTMRQSSRLRKTGRTRTVSRKKRNKGEKGEKV
jgi:hypothetical protein